MKNNIEIIAVPEYLAEESEPMREHYVFGYTITIHNKGTQGAKLLSRHWIITDANGQVSEVKGAGVVGEQPHIKAGEKYQYSSYAVIATPVGAMRGSYHLIGDDESFFDAEIPPFSLAVPDVIN